ncbi:hypothetical protein [Photobacterium kishitanii]|uniref:Uncharacterized protein n=1 Tax=Photobacterium kishitanii TaxID=318456 RepID=A0A2T3KL92_9GAMM|nr:hypothetical protein [Photobacterium kishitanii]PSV00420.1 hypothetical protein C9J27_04630 [Photobacterium kishitanii]
MTRTDIKAHIQQVKSKTAFVSLLEELKSNLQGCSDNDGINAMKEAFDEPAFAQLVCAVAAEYKKSNPFTDLRMDMGKKLLFWISEEHDVVSLDNLRASKVSVKNVTVVETIKSSIQGIINFPLNGKAEIFTQEMLIGIHPKWAQDLLAFIAYAAKLSVLDGNSDEKVGYIASFEGHLSFI